MAGWTRDQKVGAGILIGIAVLAVIAHLTDEAGSSGSGAHAAAPAPTSVVFVAPPTPLPTSALLLHHTGTGQWTSPHFTAPGDWTLRYSYTCAAFGNRGNFIVTIYGPGGSSSLSGVNELGWGRSGSTSVHDLSGPGIYLAVNSECDWRVQAIR